MTTVGRRARKCGDFAIQAWSNVDLCMEQFDRSLPGPIDPTAKKFASLSWDLWVEFNKAQNSKNESKLLATSPLVLCLANLHVLVKGETLKKLNEVLEMPDDPEKVAKIHTWILFAFKRLISIRSSYRFTCLNKLLISDYDFHGEDPREESFFWRYSHDMMCFQKMENFRRIAEKSSLWNKERRVQRKLPQIAPLDQLKKNDQMVILTNFSFEALWLNLDSGDFPHYGLFNVPCGSNETRAINVRCIKSVVWADYGEFEECIVCGHEFKYSTIRAYFFAPNNDMTLGEMEEKLDGDKVLGYIRQVSRRYSFKEFLVDTQIPVFGLNVVNDLAPCLKGIGLEILFNPEGPNLKFGAPDQKANLTTVHQQASFQAGWGSTSTLRLVKEPKLVIPSVASRERKFYLRDPFLFVVFDYASTLIMYIGRVVDPSKCIYREREEF